MWHWRTGNFGWIFGGLWAYHGPPLELGQDGPAAASRSAKDVLLFRFRLPGAPGFIRVIQMLTEEVGYGMEEVMTILREVLTFHDASPLVWLYGSNIN